MIKIIKPNKYLLITALLLTPLALAYLSNSFFKDSSKEVYSQIEKKEGSVAGVSTTSIRNISDRFPIIPGAEIVSIDTSNENTYVTLESNKTQEEIKKFYSESKINEDTEINIKGSIIKVILKN